MEKVNIPEIFAEDVFTDAVMQQRLPKSIYKQFKKSIEEGKDLDLATADVIANEIREWAIGKGATHFAHLFQPLTGVTAEKQDNEFKVAIDKIVADSKVDTEILIIETSNNTIVYANSVDSSIEGIVMQNILDGVITVEDKIV